MDQFDLSYNRYPAFTRWVLEHKLLASPLVIVDVGVLGGPSARWEHLCGQVKVYGFDALEEAIAPLKAAGKPNHHYFVMAIGNEDGERQLFLAAEPTASSLYQHGTTRYDTSESVKRNLGTRSVAIRCLDSLLAEGAISRADFLKIDTEGFEPEVLKGAHALLSDSVLALEIETNFDSSHTLPETHFGAVHTQLLPHGFLVYDLGFDRVRTASYAQRARQLGIAMPRTVSRPATVNALFYRNTPSRGAEETLKRVIILELYGMIDTAYDVLMMSAATLDGGFPLQEAADQLLRGAQLWSIARHTSVRVAMRESVFAVSSALRHSLAYRLGGPAKRGCPKSE